MGNLPRLWKYRATNVRLEAVERIGIEDQAVLAEIARSDSDWRVRHAAVKRIRDQAVLAEIAKSDSSAANRQLAVMRIEDQAVLAEIAKSDSFSHVRREAVSRIKAQAVLAEIVRSDSEAGVRQVAVLRIEDQAVLAEIARSDSSVAVRRKAVSRITDKDVRQEAVKQEKDKQRTDLTQLDLTQLIKGIDHDMSPFYFSEGMEELARRGEPAVVALLEALDKLSLHGRDNAVKVLRKIGDGRAANPLMRMVREDTSALVRAQAIYALSDLLEVNAVDRDDAVEAVRVSLSHPSQEVKKAAVDFLTRYGVPDVVDTELVQWDEDEAKKRELLRNMNSLLKQREWSELLTECDKLLKHPAFSDDKDDIYTAKGIAHVYSLSIDEAIKCFEHAQGNVIAHLFLRGIYLIAGNSSGETREQKILEEVFNSHSTLLEDDMAQIARALSAAQQATGWRETSTIKPNIDQLVDEIINLMVRVDQIFEDHSNASEEGTPAYHQVRECEERLVGIGNELYDMGGMELMREVYQRVYQEGRFTGRYLDGVWGRTKGDWMG